MGIWLGDSWSPNYLIEESSSSDCRAEGCWILSMPRPLEPWCLGLASHEDVKLAKARVWVSRDGWEGFLGKRKSPFALLWLKTLLALGLRTVVNSRSSARHCLGRMAGRAVCEPCEIGEGRRG